ncbi:MAG: tetratricopeptide repeat protein [Chthonomonadaceae bacterium]|nr:tetratricopeptide repeat protein [Chthonomonadaceae bacterium]
MAIDVLPLWNFQNVAESKARFESAMLGADNVDRLILWTQIARCRGLRSEWAQAQEILENEVKPFVESDPEVAARYHLEFGRTLCSAAHKQDEVQSSDREQARRHYLACFDICQANKLDYLAIDALHMMTCVDTDPNEQMAWNQKALDYMDSSDQVQAKIWEGSLTHNMGYALHLAERYDEAIAMFQRSLELRERAGKPIGVRIAKWMIARTLRVKGELNRAEEMQLGLEAEYDADGDKDQYVFQELDAIYRAKGDYTRADHYRLLFDKASMAD